MTAVPAPRAGRREWIALAVLALPCLLVTMDLTVLYLAVPELARDLEPSSSQLLWITDIYGFLIAGSLITMGTLGDRIGRRRLLLTGAAAFAAASALAAFSTTPEMLIGARALLGVAGATLMPSTLSLIRTLFEDPRQRTLAIGVWATSLSVGAAIGPVVGGSLLELFWWGSVFLLAVPVMALLLLLGPRLLPEYRDPAPGRFDLASAALSLAAVLAVVYGIKRLAEDGPGAASTAAIAAGLALAAVFVRRQAALDDPLIDLRLFRAPAFSASLAANMLAIFAILGTDLYIAQYLQLVLGMGPLQAGLWTLPAAGGFVVGSLLTPVLARRLRPAAAAAGGMALAGLGAAVLAQADLAAIVAGSTILSLGLAPVMTLGTDLIVGAAPAERAGAASAISETGIELGGALGIALLGSLGTAVYRSQAPDGAHDTLAGAPAALLEAANAAFTQGFRAVAAASAALLLGAALAAVVLRRYTIVATVPPSADQAAPVTVDAASEQRKATTAAISRGSAKRPSGTRAACASSAS